MAGRHGGFLLAMPKTGQDLQECPSGSKPWGAVGTVDGSDLPGTLWGIPQRGDYVLDTTLPAGRMLVAGVGTQWIAYLRALKGLLGSIHALR